MPNALARETSPYLRQHQDNPVDWLPWGEEALARAQRENRPLLVSIGYSACHWCHVMERESFEDERTATLMNDGFVCVKVDREERPDVDAIYMDAVQGMTGHGGWPLNVFLTPDGVPFYGGTYFPPTPRQGMPAFPQVLEAIVEAWRERGAEIQAETEELSAQLAGAANLRPSTEPPSAAALVASVQSLAHAFDARAGGFGRAPKFPQAPLLEFLLARAGATGPSGPAGQPAAPDQEAARKMALATLHAMAAGGIHDQIGGGFHRYAVDAGWRIPHFEKMLYDNALLARAYLHAHQLSGDAALAEVVRGTLDWALREMLAPEAGFFSALDADSDGREGAFYVWRKAEIAEVLDEDAAAAIAWLGITAEGNFEDPHHPEPGLNVLYDATAGAPVAGDEQERRARIRRRLLEVRAARVRPGLDDKRLTSWNALMIAALADAGGTLAETRYLDAARACAEFVLGSLRDADGRLLRTYSGGEAKLDAYLEDHAFLLEALIVLFEATCEERWLGEATALADTLIARFGDPGNGGFYTTASDAEPLIVRRKDVEDNPIPSGSSSAANGLLRLAELTGSETYAERAGSALALVRDIAPRYPQGFGHALQGMHWQLAAPRPIACPVPSGLGPGR
jgi:uncharacterized protein YyaL (SSP411 family)